MYKLSSPLLAVVMALMAILVTVSVTMGNMPDESYEEPIIVRIQYEEIDDLSRLEGIDLFEYNNLEKKYILAAVSDVELAGLRDDGWFVVVEQPPWLPLVPQAYYNGYRTVDELYQEMADLNAQHPNLTELVSYGQSHCYTQNGCETPGGEQTEGYKLLAMRVTNETLPGSSVIGENSIERGQKPVFFIMANIHARELTTPEIAMRWLDLVLNEYGRDAEITWLVDWHELWIVPTANPDGHWITELDTVDGYPLLHRKNFDRDADNNGVSDCNVWPSLAYSQFGVDLNRNHGFAWQAPSSTTSACSQTYPGPAPVSEPEVAALQDLISALFADWRGPELDDPAAENTSGLLLTLHSYGDMVLRPWAFAGFAPPNEDSLKAIGDKLAGLNGYRSCRSPDCLYLSNGTTDDWVYGELGIPAFTFEIGNEDQGFRPPYSVIDAEQWPNNQSAFLYAAKISRRPYQLVHGPVVTNLAVRVEAPEKPVVEVVISDSDHGGLFVESAEYSLDLPFWSKGVEPLQMISTNDHPAVQAEFTADLDVSNLAPGQHVIFIRGNDIDGHTGATSAAYFTIPNSVNTTPYLFFMPITIS